MHDCVCVCVCIYVCIYVCMYVCMYVCVYVYVCVCVGLRLKGCVSSSNKCSRVRHSSLPTGCLGARQLWERRGGGCTKRGVVDINLFVIVAALVPFPRRTRYQINLLCHMERWAETVCTVCSDGLVAHCHKHDCVQLVRLKCDLVLSKYLSRCFQSKFIRNLRVRYYGNGHMEYKADNAMLIKHLKDRI